MTAHSPVRCIVKDLSSGHQNRCAHFARFYSRLHHLDQLLHNMLLNLIIGPMTEKEIVLETIRALPDDCSLEEIAERVEFMAAVQKGLDQLDRGEGIPHDEVKKQLASWLTN